MTSIGVDAAAIGMTALGDTLVAAARVNGAMSGASAKLITAIGACLQKALITAQDGTYLLTHPLVLVKHRKELTTNIASYLSTLKSSQKVFQEIVGASDKEETKS